MFNLSEYMKNLTSELTRVFGDRLFYIGLQGSYARGEADESSDLDVMVFWTDWERKIFVSTETLYRKWSIMKNRAALSVEKRI